MSFANPPDPIGANASFTALSEPYNILNLSETPNFNSSTDIILNQMHSSIPYNLDSSPLACLSKQTNQNIKIVGYPTPYTAAGF